MYHRFRLLLTIIMFALFLASCGTSPALEDEMQDSEVVEEEAIVEEDIAVEEPTPTVVPTPTVAAPTLTEGPTKDMYAVEDVARVNAFLVRVDEVKTATETEYGKPQDGNQFVLVSITLENTSNERQEIAPLLHMVVEDASGTQYPLDVSAGTGFLAVNGPIAAGESVTATVGYQVPQNAQDLRWVFRTTEADATQGLKETGKAVFGILP